MINLFYNRIASKNHSQNFYYSNDEKFQSHKLQKLMLSELVLNSALSLSLIFLNYYNQRIFFLNRNCSLKAITIDTPSNFASTPPLNSRRNPNFLRPAPQNIEISAPDAIFLSNTTFLISITTSIASICLYNWLLLLRDILSICRSICSSKRSKNTSKMRNTRLH